MVKIKSSSFFDEPNVAIDVRSRPVGEPERPRRGFTAQGAAPLSLDSNLDCNSVESG